MTFSVKIHIYNASSCSLMNSFNLLLPCFLMKEDGFSNNLHQGYLQESKNIVERGLAIPHPL